MNQSIFSRLSSQSKLRQEGSRLSLKKDQEWNPRQQQQRKLKQLVRSMAQPAGYSLDASVEFIGRESHVQPRRYGSSMSYGVGDYGLSHRGNLMMEKDMSGEEEDFVLCVELDAKVPKPVVVRREEFLRDDLTRTSTVKIAFGKSCTNDRKISITVILKTPFL